ncbi:VWA domain-containing protein [Cupriavidus campinensis]
MTGWLGALAQFHFLRPAWLLVLIAAAWLPWAAHRHGDVRRRWRGTIAPHLLDALVVGENRQRRLRPAHLAALLLALGAIALAGPAWEREHPPFLADKAPLAIAVALAPTMDGIDVSPTRLERAKLKIKALLAHRDGGRTALYAYAGSTHMVLPLTDDAALLQTFADALQTRIMPVPGRDTALAVRTIDAAFAKEPVPGTILLLTDAVEPGAAEALKASRRTQVVVLAIGTEAGGPLREGDGVAPGLDRAALRGLRDSGIPLATVTPDSDADVAWVQRHVQSHVEQAHAQDTQRWHDAGWPLTIPIALLAALWFRKGWTVRWIAGLLAAVALQGPPASGHAQAVETTEAPRPWRWQDLWLTHDQQGRRAFEKGDFDTAAQRFDDPAWRGVALYRDGRYAEAGRAFGLVNTPEAQFNLGNALARQGKYQEASARYRLVLQQRPGWQPARHNLALMQQMLLRKPRPQDDEEAPDIPPDKIEIDPAKPPPPPSEGDKMQQGLRQQNAEMWMRAIQTTPTELLARKFALQQAKP